MTKGQVTSVDVAKRAKVSQSAVSRTFTPGGSVSAEARDRVMKAAEELGYRPNAIARAMISGRSKLIALLVAYLDNHYYPPIIERLSRLLQDRGYHVLLFMTKQGRQDQVVQQILQYQVDGIIMASATLSSRLARECANTGIPVVLFNRYVTSSPASSVTADNLEGGRLIASFLAHGGHERIAFIAGQENASTNRDREAGFYNCLAEHGLAVCAREVGNYQASVAAEATRRLFRSPERPDAVFVANDQMAFAVMDVLRLEFGLRIPEDVSIVGFDNVAMSSSSGYQLTTVSQPTDAMIDATISTLLEQIEKREVKRRAIMMPTELVIRSSTRIPETYRPSSPGST